MDLQSTESSPDHYFFQACMLVNHKVQVSGGHHTDQFAPNFASVSDHGTAGAFAGLHHWQMAWLPELMQRASIYVVDGLDSTGYLRCFKILHCVCWLHHKWVHYKPGSMPLDKLGLSNLLFQGHVAMDEAQAAHLRHESLFMPSSEVLAASPSSSTAFPRMRALEAHRSHCDCHA